MLGFNVKALDDCGAFPRYEPLGCIIWAQVTPGCYAWRNIRVDFTQVTTNKSPVSPNRGYSRMQHLWLTERICDIVGAELGIDPVEMRKRNYVKTEQMPYETPNGCVYDSGDYARCLDIALELIGYDTIEERRAEAATRGKLLGFGIGSTLDSGTNNFGQSTLLNPELQFSGNNEAATVKLDIFGELVVTLGTVPQGQGHETTASQVVADILGCSPDQVHVRPGHDTFFNSHAGFSGTYASQFAVTGLGAVKGAADALRAEMITLAAAVLQAPEEAIELADGFARIKDGPPEAALPFMALGAIVNANNAFLPPDFNPTLNHRFVYRPYFGMVDTEKKTGKLTLTYATQIHACVVEVDRETGVVEIVDYAAVDDCGTRIHPQIVEGQVHGATVHAIGAALYEDFVYDEDGQLLTSNFYDYHVPHALDVPSLKTGAIESPSPFSPLGSKGMGEGGGGGIHCIGSAIQDALKPVGRADRLRQLQPVPPRLVDAAGPGVDARQRLGGAGMKVEGTKELSALARRRLAGAERPGPDGEADARRRGLRDQGRPPLAGEGEDPARPRRPADDDRLREGRGARARVRAAEREGQRRRRDHEHGDAVQPRRERHRHDDALGGGREDRRPRRRDGPARAAADHQPAGRERARRRSRSR